MAVTYDYKKFQEDHMGHFDYQIPGASSYIPPLPKKGPSMPIFKFTTQKPSALKIWTTLIDTPIHPREGYTEDQIRYRMFIFLQLAFPFKESITKCNLIIDSDKYTLSALLVDTCTLASCQESDFSDLSVLSDAFPHWVSSELYVPYYLTKMLCHRLEIFSLMTQLFDRTSMLSNEVTHMDTDSGYGEKGKGLTAYKLYNSLRIDDMLPFVTISYDRIPAKVTSKGDIISDIRHQLLQSIEVSHNHIIPEGAKTTIPYFVFKAPLPKPPSHYE